MKLTCIITTLLLSSSLSHGASAAEILEGELGCHLDEHSLSALHHAALTKVESRRGSVFRDKILRNEKGYSICQTSDPLTNAFLPDSTTQVEWKEATTFLWELTLAGFRYTSENVMSEQHTNIRALNVKFWKEIMLRASEMVVTTHFGGYLSEVSLYDLYNDIIACVAELDGQSDPELKNLNEMIYRPINDWLKGAFPLISLYEYIDTMAADINDDRGFRRFTYIFHMDKYFKDFYKKPEYLRVKKFASQDFNNQSEFKNDILHLQSIVKGEHLKTVRDINTDGGKTDIFRARTMHKVRWLESIKDQERAFFDKWSKKIEDSESLKAIEEEERKSRVKAIQEAKRLKSSVDPKDVLAQMIQRMTSIGPDDDVKQSPQKNKGVAQTQSPTAVSGGKTPKTQGKVADTLTVTTAKPASGVVTPKKAGSSKESQQLTTDQKQARLSPELSSSLSTSGSQPSSGTTSPEKGRPS